MSLFSRRTGRENFQLLRSSSQVERHDQETSTFNEGEKPQKLLLVFIIFLWLFVVPNLVQTTVQDRGPLYSWLRDIMVTQERNHSDWLWINNMATMQQYYILFSTKNKLLRYKKGPKYKVSGWPISGWLTKYSKCMKTSSSTSTWNHCFAVTEANSGKVYLQRLYKPIQWILYNK
jgi:hypothetical protein